MNEPSKRWDVQPKIWSVFSSSGVRTELDNLSYLEYLYEKSRMLITSSLSLRDKIDIRHLIWDLEEIKEYSFFRLYIISIDNQIASLKRVLICEKIHKDIEESSYARFNSAD